MPPKKDIPDTTIFMDVNEIKEKLKLYDRIESKDVKDLHIGTRITYIEVMPDKTFKFKSGGVMIINAYPKYLMLTNNKKTWSVQLDRHIIFREQYQNYMNKIKELEKKVKKLEKINIRLLEKLQID